MRNMQEAPTTPDNETLATSQTPQGQGASLARPRGRRGVNDPWLVRFAEPIATHVRWWTLILAIVALAIGVAASFGYLITTNLAVNIVLSLITFLALIIGVGSLARFVLDVIITRRTGRRVPQRAVEHTV